jgi:hypothetical protein
MTFNYEYTASALSHAGQFEKDEYDFPQVNEWIAKLNRTHSHYVSALFNAYTEKDMGEVLKSKFSSFHNLMADSGGLQMMTLGHGKISDAAKEKIYDIQARDSSIAMIFDEIPTVSYHDQKKIKEAGLKVKAELKNNNSRYFDPDLFKDCAKETARNILNQIKHFDKVGSETKIICVLQGNDTSWYQKWLDVVLKNIPRERWERLGGIAFGSPAYGSGVLEDVEKYFFISKIEAPKHLQQHFHLLGVGSIKRMYPLVPMRNSGIIPESTLISYDSTKHTGGLSRGDIQMEENCVRVYRDTKQNLEQAERKIQEFATNVIGHEIENMKFVHDVLLWTLSDVVKMHGDTSETRHKIIVTKFLFLMTSIYNFISTFERCHKDEKYFAEVCDFESVLALKSVKTWDDFNKWKNFAKYELTSSKVGVKPTVTMEDFFT